jgi:hypothetical protein
MVNTAEFADAVSVCVGVVPVTVAPTVFPIPAEPRYCQTAILTSESLLDAFVSAADKVPEPDPVAVAVQARP